MASTATARRPRRQISEARKAEIEARRAEIETAAEAINEDDEPDFRAFLARWGTRYNVNNLRRLWVQAPRATCLHKFGTWQGMGRQVRKGETAIYLMHPRTGTDPDKVTPANPNGEVFYGASWMALFDYAQTDPVGDFTDTAPADAAPGLVAEAKRLRAEAIAIHPEKLGVNPGEGKTSELFQAACARFQAAWKRYEDARDRLKGGQQ